MHKILLAIFIALSVPTVQVQAEGLSQHDQFGVCFTGQFDKFEMSLSGTIQDGYPHNEVPHWHFNYLQNERGWTEAQMQSLIGKCAIIEVALRTDENGLQHHEITLPKNETYLTITSADEAMSGPALGDNYCTLAGNACDKGGRNQRGSTNANKGVE